MQPDPSQRFFVRLTAPGERGRGWYKAAHVDEAGRDIDPGDAAIFPELHEINGVSDIPVGREGSGHVAEAFCAGGVWAFVYCPTIPPPPSTPGAVLQVGEGGRLCWGRVRTPGL